MNIAKSLMYISLIVSSEEGVDFYKNLGFVEKNRVKRLQCHDEVINLENEFVKLEIYKDATHPKKENKPEPCGLRYLCFEVERIDGECQEDAQGKYKYIFDPDNQAVKIREVYQDQN